MPAFVPCGGFGRIGLYIPIYPVFALRLASRVSINFVKPWTDKEVDPSSAKMVADESKGAVTDSVSIKHDGDAYKSGETSSSSLDLNQPCARVKDIGECAFDAVEDPRYYRPIDSYEGIHRWDPDFEWTDTEEKRIIRKVCARPSFPKMNARGRIEMESDKALTWLYMQIDWRVCTFACVTFFALQLDRGNIVQAMSDNMLDDLGMDTNDYNTGQTIFYLIFLFAELPSQLLSKKLGPDRWIPIQMFCWSLIAACQAFLKNRAGYFACRALLGLFEGGL